MSDSLPMTIPAPLTQAQRTQIINLVRRTARAEILPRFRTLVTSDIDQKSGPMDMVTAADREAEKMIVRGLLAMFPNALMVGEETMTEEKIAALADAEMGFTIDPVDGTWNFAHGLCDIRRDPVDDPIWRAGLWPDLRPGHGRIADRRRNKPCPCHCTPPPGAVGFGVKRGPDRRTERLCVVLQPARAETPANDESHDPVSAALYAALRGT